MNTKRTTLGPVALLCLVTLLAAGTLTVPEARAITIATVPISNPVSNPVNANDPATGSVHGSVAYNYSIGKYDVTVGQYTAFLNAVAATDTNALYNPNMATDLNIAGIAQKGSSGSYTYSVIGSANHPITYVSWYDAARFTNWLNNGQPTGAEGPGITETGAYTMTSYPSRNAGATWFIPTENEWYKAAYYDPRTTAQGGPPADSHYWKYATGTNTTPTSALPGSTPNAANFYDNTTGYAANGSTSNSDSQNYLTDVGAYTASASPYGTFDQSGDVEQWNETLGGGGGGFRGRRGGAWDYSFADNLSSSFSNGDFPGVENSNMGFRVASVASVPEPSTFVLAGTGFVSLLTYIRQRRRRSPSYLNRPNASVI